MRLLEIYTVGEAPSNEVNIPQRQWSWDRDTWWEDKPVFYHGTHIDNLDVISKHGIRAGHGSKGHGVYLAFDPLTARGYASMAAAGGERSFKGRTRPPATPMEERVVLVVEIPRGDLKRLKTSKKDTRVYDRESWEREGKGNPRYWELAEVVYPTDIPPSYIKGWMQKV